MLDGIGKTGAILNIIGASFLIFILLILFFPFIVFPIITIITNTRFLKGKNNKVSAGVWGILFGFLVGGILVLCSGGNSIETKQIDDINKSIENIDENLNLKIKELEKELEKVKNEKIEEE